MGSKRKIILVIAVMSALVLTGAVFPFLGNNQLKNSPPAVTESFPTGELVQLKSLVLVDVYRPVAGTMVQIYHHESPNVITNVGLYALARHLGGQTAAFQWTAALGGNDQYYRSTAPTYIALSSDSAGVDATHSSWQAVDSSYPADIEIITDGLQRGTGTLTIGVAYTAGSGGTKGSHTYSLSRTFTVGAGGSFTSVQKAGLFNNVYNTNNGSTSALQISALIAENTFTPVDLNAGDQIAVTWRITL